MLGFEVLDHLGARVRGSGSGSRFLGVDSKVFDHFGAGLRGLGSGSKVLQPGGSKSAG